jgi:hypothetical protein
MTVNDEFEGILEKVVGIHFKGIIPAVSWRH